MQWHVEDIPLLIHSIPHALHDLMQHEDKELVKKTIASLPIKKQPVSGNAPRISIEKTLDPMAQRAAQNIGLLLHDYLQQLPEFDGSQAESEKLLEHWRRILLEQPQRLSVAKSGHFHNESSKNFWQDQIAAHHAEHNITHDSFNAVWDDWQRAAGTLHNAGDINQLAATKKKQWEDIVLRARCHKEVTERLMNL